MSPRRRRRGYIEQLPSGRHRAVVYVGVDPLTRRPQYLRETVATYADAEQALSRLHRQVDENQHPKSAITVGEVIDRWLEVADLEETTRDRYDDLIRLYIRPTVGHMPVGKLDAELLERFYARLLRCKTMCTGRPPEGHTCTPLSTSTTRKIHYILRGALERAVRWRYVSVNVASMAAAPAPRKTQPDPPSPVEVAALLNDAWTDPEWGLMLGLTMTTGCRRGELCALRWHHLDVERATLWVARDGAQRRSRDPASRRSRPRPRVSAGSDWTPARWSCSPSTAHGWPSSSPASNSTSAGARSSSPAPLTALRRWLRAQ